MIMMIMDHEVKSKWDKKKTGKGIKYIRTIMDDTDGEDNVE